MSDLPCGWTICTLIEIASAIQYGYTEKSIQLPVGPRFLRITDIQNDSVDWAHVPFCEIGDREKDKYLLQQGDSVFARTGATVGKSYLIRGSIPEAVFASYLIRVRLKEETADPRYIAYFFKSSEYWRQISESQAGIGQPNVNGQNCYVRSSSLDGEGACRESREWSRTMRSAVFFIRFAKRAENEKLSLLR